MNFDEFELNTDDIPEVSRDVLAENPIAQRVFTLAEEKGIKLNNYDALARIIDNLDNESLTDTKSIIIIAEIVERLITLNNMYINSDFE